MEMCAGCRSREEKIRALAARFRAKAQETRLADYAALMLRTAQELERRAAAVAQRCCPHRESIDLDQRGGLRPGENGARAERDPGGG